MENTTGKPVNAHAHFKALFACAALALTACGGGAQEPGAAAGDRRANSSGDEGASPVGAVHKSGSGSASARMGAAGGSLTLSTGPKVEIPPGAIKGAEDVVLREAPGTTAFLNEESERPIGPTFVVSPDIQAPEGQTIRVSIPLAAYPEGYGDVAIAYEYSVGDRVGAEDSEHTRWQYESAKLSGGRAVADLPALNGYRLQFVLSNLEAQ